MLFKIVPAIIKIVGLQIEKRHNLFYYLATKYNIKIDILLY